MKLKSTLLAATLMVFVVSSATVFAAEEQHDATKAGKAEQAKSAKKIKRHNHMEEKTGMPMAEPASGANKQETMKPMQNHDHMKEKH